MRFFAMTVLSSAALLAQAPDMKTASGYARSVQASLKNNVVKSAAKMSEENYGFKPTPEVRSFGQLLGHIANAEYNFCAAVLGEKNPNTINIEKEKTSKADLTEAVQGAFAYCEKAYAGMTDDKVAETAKMGNNERNKLGILNFNNAHTNEHYGNLVTYMRLKGLVPPSSER
jgi:uncharacterized damage-inducible protein DinB